MYKLDLTKKVIATGFRRDYKTGEQTEVVVETPLSNFVSQSLKRVRSFSEAEKVRGLIGKVKTGNQIEVTGEEMKVVFEIFKRTETETMLAFADMANALNEGFDIVDYEKANTPA